MSKTLLLLAVTISASLALGAIQPKPTRSDKVKTNQITKDLNTVPEAEKPPKKKRTKAATATLTLPEKVSAEKPVSKSSSRKPSAQPVATVLPAESSSQLAGAQAPIPGASYSSARTNVVLPESEKPVTWSASAELSRGSINGTSGSPDSTYTQIRPEVTANIQQVNATAYANIGALWTSDSGPDSPSARIFGRPEIGAVKTLWSNEKATVAGAFGLKLPFVDTSIGNSDQFKVWEFAPSAAGSYYIGKNSYAVGSAGLTYNTNASVGTPVGEFTLKQAPTLNLAIGAQTEIEKATLGAALNMTQGLTNSELSGNGYTLARGAVNSAYLSAYGTYAISEQTKAVAKVTKGLRTDFDKINSQIVDNISKAADTSITVGVSNSF